MRRYMVSHLAIIFRYAGLEVSEQRSHEAGFLTFYLMLSCSIFRDTRRRSPFSVDLDIIQR